ncbi:MAG: hypothetical protein JW747_02765 [Candidatus Aminicenantes bacterium]|nr:hypothetical protein [Candidatus Aminicenantes bacterium]
MSVFPIVLLSVFGFLALVVGGLVFLWFHQGGCCVRRARQKISRKNMVRPVLEGTPGEPGA